MTLVLMMALLTPPQQSPPEARLNAAQRETLQQAVRALDTSVARLEPAWKLASSEAWERQTVMKWRRVASTTGPNPPAPAVSDAEANRLADTLRAQIFPFDSRDEAVAALEAARQATPVAPERSLKGLGDGGFLWRGRDSVVVRFSAGKLMFWVAGPSLDLVERFAHHMVGVAETLEKK